MKCLILLVVERLSYYHAPTYSIFIPHCKGLLTRLS